jgi:hypothetical protein
MRAVIPKNSSLESIAKLYNKPSPTSTYAAVNAQIILIVHKGLMSDKIMIVEPLLCIDRFDQP